MMRSRRHPFRLTPLVVLLALTGTACAGEVGRYRNAAVGPDGVTIRAVAGPAGAGEESASRVPHST